MKWGSTALTVLILAVWVASARWGIGYVAKSINFEVIGGSVDVIVWGQSDRGYVKGLHTWRTPRFEWWYWEWLTLPPSKLWEVVFPIWIFAIPPFLTASVAWRLDRRKPPGTCTNCGYDRTGLTADAVCPECGEVSTKVRR